MVANTFTQEKADTILERVACGEGITEVCADPDMPHIATWFRWLDAHDGLREAYARARENCGHVHASKAVQEAMSATDAAIGRLRMDALKWAASRYAPKDYGDSTQLRHADADGQKLDTASLVGELLGLMGGKAPVTIESTARNVTPRDRGDSAFGAPPIEQRLERQPAPSAARVENNESPQPARRAYRPRGRSNVDDLV